MARAIMVFALLSGLLSMVSCAESLHQIQSERIAGDIPPELEHQIDPSVTFSDLLSSADRYAGRVVTVGGIVLAARRTKERTELEILQLPSKGGQVSPRDRAQSEGRFLAVREAVFDPATLPPGTPITVIGAVVGSVTRPLDEGEYIYPVLEIKHVIDWNRVASQDFPRSPAGFLRPYYSPFAYWGVPYGYLPYWRSPYPYVIQPRPSAPPPPPPARVSPRLRSR